MQHNKYVFLIGKLLARFIAYLTLSLLLNIACYPVFTATYPVHLAELRMSLARFTVIMVVINTVFGFRLKEERLLFLRLCLVPPFGLLVSFIPGAVELPLFLVLVVRSIIQYVRERK